MSEITRTICVGDIHGRIDAIKEAYTNNPDALIIQLGDFGFKDTYAAYLPLFDANRLKIVGGNHDEYPFLVHYPHYLGDFGAFDLPDGRRVFFIRGAWSIDKHRRTPGVSWWHEEELNLGQQEQCFQLWEKECKNIDIMLTHDAPATVQKAILSSGGGMFGGDYYPNNTGEFLDQILKHHQPPKWFFAHWHNYWGGNIYGTEFRCVNIDEDIEI